MIIVDVDFNNIDGQGRVRTLPSSEFGTIVIGDHVRAVDSLEDMEFDAVVADRAEDGSLILEMAWSKPTKSVLSVHQDFGRSTYAAMASVTLHMPVLVTLPKTSETFTPTARSVGATS